MGRFDSRVKILGHMARDTRLQLVLTKGRSHSSHGMLYSTRAYLYDPREGLTLESKLKVTWYVILGYNLLVLPEGRSHSSHGTLYSYEWFTINFAEFNNVIFSNTILYKVMSTFSKLTFTWYCGIPIKRPYLQHLPRQHYEDMILSLWHNVLDVYGHNLC